MKKFIYAGPIGLGILLFYMVYLFYLDDESTASKNNRYILALGDSLTYGIGDLREKGYIGQLKEILNAAESSAHYQVLNYAIPNQESEGVVKQLLNVNISEKVNEVDYVILYIGTNDFRYSSGGNFLSIDQSKLNKEREEYLNHIQTILNSIRFLNKDVPVIVLGLYNPFPDDHHIDRHITEWNIALKTTIEKESNTHFIPTNDLFRQKNKKLYFDDALHLNHTGYHLIAKRISKEIN